MFKFRASDREPHYESMIQCEEYSEWEKMRKEARTADLRLYTVVDDFADYYTTKYRLVCSAGSYATDTGCKQCRDNTYSSSGASTCTSCPSGKVSVQGSTSVADCRKETVNSCPEDEISKTGPPSLLDCQQGKLNIHLLKLSVVRRIFKLQCIYRVMSL